MLNVLSPAKKKPSWGMTCPVRSTTASIVPLPPEPSPMTIRVRPSRLRPGVPAISKYSSLSELG